MVSALAMEDIQSLMEEGCEVPPSSIIRLNALGIKIEKKPEFALASLPRVALCGDVLFRQPTIAQDIFIDQMLEILNDDEGTKLALEAYVLAHHDKDWFNLPRFPKLFATKCSIWIKTHLGKETATKVRQAIDFCKYGMNPNDGEYPVYVTDETFEKWFGEAGPLSLAMKDYVQACTFGIAPETALRATSPRLTAMIQRAAILHDVKVEAQEKIATAEYYNTLHEIQEQCRKARDEKLKKKNQEANEVKENG